MVLKGAFRELNDAFTQSPFGVSETQLIEVQCHQTVKSNNLACTLPQKKTNNLAGSGTRPQAVSEHLLYHEMTPVSKIS